MNPKTNNGGERDEFWDISTLLPPKKRGAISSDFAKTEAVPVTLSRPDGEGVSDAPLTARRVPLGEEALPPEPDERYFPENSLLREVRIYRWKNSYGYYEQFCRHAHQLYAKEGKECAFVDFFSYMPQYTQLNRAQLSYYLWWRTSFRRQTVLETTYSYLLLYLYELINLEECDIAPKEVQTIMLRLWLSYRKQFPRLDGMLREWLCDYSLVHRLPPPELPSKLMPQMLSGCRLKEFYVASTEETDTVTRAMLLFCNNYDYKKSKFYRGDAVLLFDRVLPEAVARALSYLRQKEGKMFTGEDGFSTITRDTFIGAVCSYRLKRRIEVDFVSFSHTHELRYVITDVLKYAENAIRQVMGVKSRLSVYDVDVELRDRLDAYFKEVLPQKRQSKQKESKEPPEYEKRYDLPYVEVSPARAQEIERLSWGTTKRLIEAFEAVEGEPETAQKAPDGVRNDEAIPSTEGNASNAWAEGEKTEKAGFLSQIYPLCDFLPFALRGDRSAQREFADKQGMLLDAIADKINTVAVDIMGDILLESQNGVYAVIEDYKEWLKEQYDGNG